jgi:hypothetical protein
MLGEARRRLSGYGERVAFKEGSFLDPLPSADAVVASLALHHVHDLQTKTELYRVIHEALSRGGVLVNLDAAVSEDTRLNALVFDRWAHRMSEHGITNSQARGHFAAWADEAKRASMRSSASGDAERPRSRVRCARADYRDQTSHRSGFVRRANAASLISGTRPRWPLLA